MRQNALKTQLAFEGFGYKVPPTVIVSLMSGN